MGHVAAVQADCRQLLEAFESAAQLVGVCDMAWSMDPRSTMHRDYVVLFMQVFGFEPKGPAARKFWIAHGGALGPGQRKRLP